MGRGGEGGVRRDLGIKNVSDLDLWGSHHHLFRF